MDARPRRSWPRRAPRRARRGAGAPRRAGCRRYRATGRARHRTAATRGSARATRDAPRWRRAWGALVPHRRPDRGGRDTPRRSPRELADVVCRTRGTPAAGAVTPRAAPRWSSWRRPPGRWRRLPGRANQRLIGRVDLIAMFRTREDARPDVARVLAERTLHLRAHLRVPPHKPRRDLAHEVAEHVVRDNELPVHVRTGPDPIEKHPDTLAHKGRGLGGHRFQQNRESAGALQRLGIAQQAVRSGEAICLAPAATELPNALR